MTKKTILEQQIKELASDEAERSKAARLREIIDTVEASLAAGVSRASVVRKLAENGLEMTIGTFNTELHRIRRKRGKPSIDKIKQDSQKINKMLQQTPNKQVVKSDNDSEPHLIASHDPRDIDKIMRSTPDLEAYSRYAKQLKKKNKS